MITFIAGMATGAGTLVALFKAMCIRWERMERSSRRRAKRAAQRKQKQRGFCGNISKDNDWMTQTMRLR